MEANEVGAGESPAVILNKGTVMLIDSDELKGRLKNLMKDATESRMMFSHYKVAVECIQKMMDVVEDLERKNPVVFCNL